MSEISIARIYVTETEKGLEKFLDYLHDTAKVRGVTVFRGISGFGDSGKVHSSGLVDLSFDLPIVIEFFDESAKLKDILSQLEQWVKPGHVISWPVNVMQKSE